MRCETPSGFESCLDLIPRVRCATLGCDVKRFQRSSCSSGNTLLQS